MASREGTRIARDLHDGIAQDLVALGYSLDLMMAVPETPTEVRVNLRTLRFSIDELISKVRREIFALRSADTPDICLELTQIAQEVCGNRLGNVNITDLNLSFDVHEVVLASATELLRNSYNHSRATQIDITLSTIEDRIFLQVEDNGIGGAHMSTTRYGLRGISERVTDLQGTFTLDSNESGTRAHITL